MARKKSKIIIISVSSSIIALLLIWAFIFYWQNLRGIIPLLREPEFDITELIQAPAEPGETDKINNLVDETMADPLDHPLDIPDGFSITLFAKDVPSARVLAFGPLGNLWVTQTDIGKITRLGIINNNETEKIEIFDGLDSPHGIAFDPADPYRLYFAEENGVSTVTLDKTGMPLGKPQKIIDLPRGGRHYTRTIGFGPDGRLFISIGSSCDVCIEKDSRTAKIFSAESDGSDFKEYSSGLRNSVFFTWHPISGDMWGTEMGRDFLGDDLPPDEINIIEDGKFYGWPYFYGKNINDKKFNSPGNGIPDNEPTPSHIDIQAHSAPLGLSFISDESWPQQYQGNLLVSYHGSWNRSVPTGYKIARFILDEEGNYQGTEDFITGWLTENGSVLGRPVDIIFGPDGSAYISDDRAGAIYRVAPVK